MLIDWIAEASSAAGLDAMIGRVGRVDGIDLFSSGDEVVSCAESIASALRTGQFGLRTRILPR